MKKKMRNAGMILGILFTVCVVFLTNGTTVQAAGLIEEVIDEIYSFSRYPIKNYRLDFYVSTSGGWLPWNWGDSIGKGVMYGIYSFSDFIWTVSLHVSSITGYVIQEAYNLDFVGDMIGKIGDILQGLSGITLDGIGKGGLYAGIISFLITIVGIYVAYTGLLKKETSKAMHAFLNLVLVFVFSAAFIAYAPDCMTMLNEFSSDLSTAVLDVGINVLGGDTKKEDKDKKEKDKEKEDEEENKTNDSTATIRDALFVMQVENPWLLLQYGTTDKKEIGEKRVEKLLSVSPSLNKGEDREKIVKEEVEKQNNLYLTVTEVTFRFAMVLFISIMNVVISIFVFLLTGMMILSQILFLIFFLVLVISFLISMIPGQENNWKKALVNLFNTLMIRAGIILIVTFTFCLSNMFYSMSKSYPLAMTMFLQIVLFAGIFMEMNKILGSMNLQTHDAEQLGRRVLHRPYHHARRQARQTSRKVVKFLTKNSKRDQERPSVPTNMSDTGPSDRMRRTDIPKRNPVKGIPSYYPQEDHGQQKKGSLGKRVGNKTGTVADLGETVKGKAGQISRQLKDAPVNMKYGVYKAEDAIKDNIGDMKTGFSEERTRRKTERTQRADDYKSKMELRRSELENRKPREKEVPKRENVVRSEPVQKEPSKMRDVVKSSGKDADPNIDKNIQPVHNSNPNKDVTERVNQNRQQKEQTAVNKAENPGVVREGKNVNAEQKTTLKGIYQNVSKRQNQNICINRQTPRVQSAKIKERKK